MFTYFFGLHFLFYWLACACCYVADVMASRDQSIMKLKLSQTPINWVKYASSVRKSLGLQIFIHLPASIICDSLFGNYNTQWSSWHLIWQLPLALNITDGLLYYTHRLFHTIPFLYKRIHSQHHQWAVPVGVSALDTHPVEHVFVNLMPVIVGILLVHANVLGCSLYIILATLNTVAAHSGFKYITDIHDLHHLHLTVNFGTGWSVFDKFHGTYKGRPLTL
jgi:sterol desaturase/sphingolipid hydroxylase (fatty acid hydroxylase superfamily)